MRLERIDRKETKKNKRDCNGRNNINERTKMNNDGKLTRKEAQVYERKK